MFKHTSVKIFVIIFFASLFAEVIANDKPLFMRFDGHFYLPFLQKISEKQLGGIFESEADYKDPIVQNLIIQDSQNFIIWAPIKFSYNTINYEINTPAPSKPTLQNLLGTDDHGRDVFARLIYGIRLSLIFGIILTFFSVIIGIIIGALQGFFAGLIDIFGQRFVEVWSAMPVLFLLIILSSFVEPGFLSLLGLMMLFSWMSIVPFVRAEFLRLRNFDFVRASKALGASNFRIIFHHILPNALPVIIANIPFLISGSIIMLTSLDFLGLGMPIGSPSLGELLSQGKNNITAWWLGVSGFVALTTILYLLISIQEHLRNIIDVRKNDLLQ
jgi:microcin C transport system permease protein